MGLKSHTVMSLIEAEAVLLIIMAGAQQTLRVKQKIEEKRRDALLGGGQKRIDTQHRKVGNFFVTFTHGLGP